MGDEVTWCDDSNPCGNVQERDVVKYIKYEEYKDLCKKLSELARQAGECKGMVDAIIMSANKVEGGISLIKTQVLDNVKEAVGKYR